MSYGVAVSDAFVGNTIIPEAEEKRGMAAGAYCGLKPSPKTCKTANLYPISVSLWRPLWAALVLEESEADQQTPVRGQSFGSCMLVAKFLQDLCYPSFGFFQTLATDCACAMRVVHSPSLGMTPMSAAITSAVLCRAGRELIFC